VSVTLALPKLGLTMEEAVVVRWLAGPGQPVEPGQPVLVVETDKVEVEVCAETAGYLQPVSQPGDVVPVGATLGLLHHGPGEAAIRPPHPDTDRQAAVGPPGRPGGQPPAGVSGGNGHGPLSWRELRASMAARSLARHHAVDLNAVTGTGPGGRIVAADVEQALARADATEPARPAPSTAPQPLATPPEPAGRIRLSGRRAAVARHLEAARAGAVPLTLNRFAPCGGLLALRNLALRRHPDLRPTVTEVAARLVAAVAARHPTINARATAEGADCYRHVNLAVAVDTDDGLVAPVVRDADRVGVAELAARLRQLVEAARHGGLSTTDVELGTFTLTNLGAYGVDFGTPVLNWPQIAILGLGRIAGEPPDGPSVGLSLTVDHRLVDGVPAARFLDDVAAAFADPGSVLL
jgi:pyruvate/2-oxoglutarate dehydrogenase complex dihydrolipoamide acyltransferase (E2) component